MVSRVSQGTIDIAKELANVPHSQIDFYTPEGYTYYRTLTERSITALVKGANLRAARIANYYDSLFTEWLALGLKERIKDHPEFAMIPKLQARFQLLKSRISDETGVRVYDPLQGLHNQEHSIDLRNLADLGDLALSLDEYAEYYSTKFHSSQDKVWLSSWFIDGTSYAVIEHKGEGNYRLKLVEPPLVKFIVDDFVRAVKSRLANKDTSSA